jgi:VWFA-related protein
MAGFFLSFALAQPSGKPEGPQGLVRLNVVATNAQGEPVTDLQAADFQVREDGKRRSLAYFQFVGSTRPEHSVPEGEFANHRLSPPTVILLDRWNERMLTATASWSGLGAALQKMESVDRVYVYFLTNHGDLFPVHPLPATDAELRSIPALSSGDLRGKLDDAVRKLQGFRDIDAQDPVLRANTTIRALDALGSQMASIAGRKNLIWVTHGMPLNTRLVTGEWADFTPQVRGLSAAAAQSEIAIYTVDESASGAAADPSGESRQTLQMFSSLTGGRWYPSDNADRAIADAFSDARATYRLAFYSPIREKDRNDHKIRVDSARKNVRILTRDRFPPLELQADSDEMQNAVFASERRSPFDASGIGLRVAVSRDSLGKTLHFKIHVNPADILLQHEGGEYEGSLAVMIAFYKEGFLKRTSAPIDCNIALNQAQFDKALGEWVVIPEDTPADETGEKIRLMVFDKGLRRIGSVTFPTN